MGFHQDDGDDVIVKGDDGSTGGVKIAAIDDAGTKRLAVDIGVSLLSEVKVSSNDATSSTLSQKLTESEGTNTNGRPLEYVEINDGGDEDLDLRFDETKIDHDALQNYVANEHIDWTQAGAGTIHASNYADNDTIYTHPNHTGEVTSTGDGAQVVDKTAISNKASVTAAATDTLLIGDASDSNNLKKVTAQSIADLAGSGSLWTDAGANTYLTSTTDTVSVGTSSAPPGNYRMLIANGAGADGLDICAGENLGDIGLHVADQDDTFTAFEIEMDQGHITFGETYAQTLANNGVVYGVDNQNDGVSADFNCQNGSYRIGGADPWQIVSSATSTSTTSTTYTLISGMTITPGAGTYIATFSSSGRAQSEDQQMQVSLFSNGVQVAHSERDHGWDTADPDNEDYRFGIHTQAVITVTAGQAIEARYKTDYSTFNIFERSLILIKVHA